MPPLWSIDGPPSRRIGSRKLRPICRYTRRRGQRKVPVASGHYNGPGMNTRERLLIEVQALTECEAAAALDFLEQQKRARQTASWPPSFAGIGHSGRSDLGARSEETLRAEFGSL